ncbi:MAG: L,D-transpeptidase [Clostridia bacterium]|nr:L,D-transpeptidase [Clostridia bacterium]
MKGKKYLPLFALLLILGLFLGLYYPKQITTAFYIDTLSTMDENPPLNHASTPVGTNTNNINKDNTGNSTGFPAEKTLGALLADKGVNGPDARLSISIIKSKHALNILLDGQAIKTFHVEFGEGGLDKKRVSGDHKTPEGVFYVCEKSILTPTDYYLGSRWLRLSYPGKEDAERGLASDLIDEESYKNIVTAIKEKKTPPQRTALGGGIGIHGGGIPEFGENWTWGCIGLSNEDVEEIYDFIGIGTTVIIKR